MTFKEFQKMCEKKHMNMVLWDFWHKESKWLCKHGYHNWQLLNKAKIIHTEENDGPYIRIEKNRKVFSLIAVCHCCGKELEIIDE